MQLQMYTSQRELYVCNAGNIYSDKIKFSATKPAPPAFTGAGLVQILQNASANSDLWSQSFNLALLRLHRVIAAETGVSFCELQIDFVARKTAARFCSFNSEVVAAIARLQTLQTCACNCKSRLHFVETTFCSGNS